MLLQIKQNMQLLKMKQMNYQKSRKVLVKDLINKFGILNFSNYLCSRILQNYLVFTPA